MGLFAASIADPLPSDPDRARLRHGEACHSGAVTTPNEQVPDRFAPIQRRSPFLDQIGELYVRQDGEQPVYGLWIRPEHANNRGGVHGGVLMTVADLVLGYTTAFGHDPPLRMATANLNIDFVGAAQIGDWLEGRAEIIRAGRSLAFAACYLTVGDRRIARANAVFAVNSAPSSEPSSPEADTR
jgi:uncharacterized protein (TIGR00369 family)